VKHLFAIEIADESLRIFIRNTFLKITTALECVAVLLGLLATAGLLLLFFVSMILGGGAINGYRDGNTFFLSSHGKYTEVSQTAFNVTWYIECSVILIFLLLFTIGPLSRVLRKYLTPETDVD